MHTDKNYSLPLSCKLGSFPALSSFPWTMGSTCCQSDSCSTFPLSRRLLAIASPQRQVLPSPTAHPHSVISGLFYNSFLAICTDSPFFLFPLSASLSLWTHPTLSEPHAGLCLVTAVTTQQLSPCFPFNSTFLLCFTLSHLLPLGWSAQHTSGVRCETVSLLGLILELVFCWYLDTHS